MWAYGAAAADHGAFHRAESVSWHRDHADAGAAWEKHYYGAVSQSDRRRDRTVCAISAHHGMVHPVYRDRCCAIGGDAWDRRYENAVLYDPDRKCGPGDDRRSDRVCVSARFDRNRARFYDLAHLWRAAARMGCVFYGEISSFADKAGCKAVDGALEADHALWNAYNGRATDAAARLSRYAADHLAH